MSYFHNEFLNIQVDMYKDILWIHGQRMIRYLNMERTNKCHLKINNKNGCSQSRGAPFLKLYIASSHERLVTTINTFVVLDELELYIS